MHHTPSLFRFTALAGSVLVSAGAACTSTIEIGAGGASSTGAGSASGRSSAISTASTSGAWSATSSSTSGAWSATSSGTSGAWSGSGGAATVSSSASSSGISSGSTCPAGAPPEGPCAPSPATCAAASSSCLARVDQAASATPGFRISQLSFSRPAVFATGVVSSVLQGSVTPDDTACNLDGSGTFSWLLRFDLAAGTLETGGARPVASPAGPYTFDDEIIPQGANSFHVQPAIVAGALTSGCTFDTGLGVDLVVPIFTDVQATQVVPLPLHALGLYGGPMSADRGCIGSYQAAGLSPSNDCQPDATHTSFAAGAALDGLISLEEADQVIVPQLDETLCVLLSGNSALYGTSSPSGVYVCKRDAGNRIAFAGDWCAATNQAATASCADAMAVAATFAAQAVQIE